MVASSYNAGMGRISGELVKQDADSSFDLWLVEETTRYVYRIMAIKQIFEAPYKYGFVLRAQDLYKRSYARVLPSRRIFRICLISPRRMVSPMPI